MIIYLLGFMGSGKSTTGRKLAARLGLGFTDLDRFIEETEGRTVESIFRDKGETYFRQIEAELLKKVTLEGNQLIACGGGTPCFFDNMEYMKKRGVTIYLKMTPGALQNRLENSRHPRPLIAGMSGQELLKYIDEKLREREEWYEKSVIITDGLNVNLKLLEEAIRHF